MEGHGINGLVIGSSTTLTSQTTVKTNGLWFWYSIIVSISASGPALNLIVIFKAKRIQDQWFRDAVLEQHPTRQTAFSANWRSTRRQDTPKIQIRDNMYLGVQMRQCKEMAPGAMPALLVVRRAIAVGMRSGVDDHSCCLVRNGYCDWEFPLATSWHGLVC